MDKLLEYILQKSNNAYQNIKLVGVFYDEPTNTSTFRFVYRDRNLYVEDKQKITSYLEEYYNNAFKVDVKLKKSYLDDDVIKEFVYRILKEDASSINNISKSNDITVMISNEDVLVTIAVSKQYHEFLLHKKLDEKIKKECDANFFGKFTIELVAKELDKNLDKALEENAQEVELQIQSLVESLQPKAIVVTDIEKIVGLDVGNTAKQITSYKSAMQKVEICGKVAFFQKRTFIAKKADATGNFPEKQYYTFNLKDPSGSIHCVYFPLKNDVDKPLTIVDGDEVILIGDFDDYNGKLSFKVKGISKCKLPEIKEEAKEFKGVNDNYLFVKPYPYVTESQANFLVQEKAPNDFLKKNEIVVFDVETTGFDFNECEIIEIGAIKLKEGRLSEVFSTFIKPINSIPDEITKLTSITNDMVKDAPNIKQVIPDFYKFCDGCVLVAYNIDFDYKFINAASTKLGYKFKNRQVDALYLARLNVAGAKNFQLKNIAARLGVSLDGAHRAINDAIATAEVLKLISDNVTP